MGNEDDETQNQVNHKGFIHRAGEPEGTHDDRCVGQKVKQTGRSYQALPFTSGHPVALENPVADKVTQ